MLTSYNGWTASGHPADFGGLDNSPIPGTNGVTFPPGFRAGDVAYVFQRFFAEYHARVEQLIAGQCWGYNFRPSTNDPKLTSCHGSATAGDADAPRHPNNTAPSRSLSAAQIATIRALLAEFDGVIHWGGDGWGAGSTLDPMHYEIATGKTAADVAALAAKLRGAPGGNPGGGTGGGTLHQGMTGDAIRELQHVLNAWYPALPKLVEDGVFGQKTTDRVKYAQQRLGLPVDGIVGDAVKRALHLP